MAKSDRRPRNRLLGLGVALTLVAVSADNGGLLESPETFLYDKRAKWAQFFAPPPSTQIVHLDIDDTSLDSIGRWPWSRQKMAELMDELRLAGPKAVALDILYTRPEDDRWEIRKLPDGSTTFVQIKSDEALAAAIGRLGNVLVPSQLRIGSPPPVSPDTGRIHDLLYRNFEMDEVQVGTILRKPVAEFLSAFIDARQKVAEQRINELWDGLLPPGANAADPAVAAALNAALKARLLPHADLQTQTPAARALDDAFEHVRDIRVIRPLTFPIVAGMPGFYRAPFASFPIPAFASAAAATGFVDYPNTLDGKVRSVPLFLEFDGRIFPQIGLMTACMLLDVSPKELRITADSVTIPMNGKSKGWNKPWTHDIVIPVRTYRSRLIDQPVETWFDIPWYGGDNWLAMFDQSHPDLQMQHVPMKAIDDACLSRRRIAQNNREIDQVLQILQDTFHDDTIAAFLAHRPADDVPMSRRAIVQTTCGILRGAGVPLDKSPEEKDLSPEERVMFKTIKAMLDADGQSVPLAAQLERQRSALRAQIAGKGVLVGAVGTGMDLKATSIHHAAPGVVAHGTIVNAILTGRFWRTAPQWVTALFILLLGALATAGIIWLSPGQALLSSALLAAAYAVFNGIVCFDRYGVIIGLAGPLAAIIGVWSAGTLFRLVTERVERARITRRFRSYVDPSLVNWVLENPDKARFDGERREMTMCFSDLASFTSLTEQLGERVVPILAEYMSAMVPVIRQHHGYVSKLMGDGIYFFFGAPKTNPHHARNAVAAVFAMFSALHALNESFARRNLPRLRLRIGVTTGQVIIGDAGATDASDYTAIGDDVNFAARLESANKALGTSALISARTVELLEDEFLVRPIAKLRVAGRQQAEWVFEPLCPACDTTEPHKMLADHTSAMVEAFSAADFDRCIKAADELERSARTAQRIAELYRKLANEYRASPPPDFDGQVILTEK